MAHLGIVALSLVVLAAVEGCASKLAGKAPPAVAAAPATTATAPVVVEADGLPAIPAGLTTEEELAFEALAMSDHMETLFVGGGASRSWLARHLRLILDSPRADRILKALWAQPKPAAKLYALCGLYWTDARAFTSGVDALRHCEDRVVFQWYCMGVPTSISGIVGSPKAKSVRLRPGHRWVADRGLDRPSVLDISGGGYPSYFAEGTLRWAAAPVDDPR
jgi:hypothetical protein